VARFELATSWSQTRRDDRATLHPEITLSISIFFRDVSLKSCAKISKFS
jgi:hypothetical protein